MLDIMRSKLFLVAILFILLFYIIFYHMNILEFIYPLFIVDKHLYGFQFGANANNVDVNTVYF